MRSWMVIIAAGLLLVLVSFLPRSSPAAEPPAKGAADAGKLADRGQELFMAKGCATCHRHDGAPGVTGIAAVGPNLSHYQSSPEFLRLWLSDPAAVRPNTMMPNLNLKTAEIEALIAFLTTGEDPGSKANGADKEKLATDSVTSAKGCPVTVQAADPFKPPKPYPEISPYEGQFWFGSLSLWTLLPTSGVWERLPSGESGYVQKVVWFREGYNWREEPMPELTVTGRRLDGPRQSFTVSDATNGYHPDLGSFMLTGVEIPDLGCWELTGEYGGHGLSFVIRVEQ